MVVLFAQNGLLLSHTSLHTLCQLELCKFSKQARRITSLISPNHEEFTIDFF